MKRLSQIILIGITLTVVLVGYLYSTRPEASKTQAPIAPTLTPAEPVTQPKEESPPTSPTTTTNPTPSNTSNNSTNESEVFGEVGLPRLDSPLKADSLFDLIAIQIPKFLLSIVAALALLFFMISAARMLLGASSPEESAKAKQGMTWAIIGMVLAVGSYAILRFIETIIKGGN